MCNVSILIKLTFIVKAIFIMSLVLFSFHSQALDIAINDSHQLNLTEHITYFKDDTDSLIISDILKPNLVWHKNKDSYLNFGHTNSNIWIKIELSNNSKKQIQKILSIDFPQLDFVDLFCDGILCSLMGDRRSFQDRDLKAFSHAYKITLEPRSSHTYIYKIRTQAGMQIPINLYDEDSFYGRESLNTGLASFIIGLFLAIFTIAVVCYNIYKVESFKFIGLYTLTGLLYLACYYGIVYRYFTSDMPSVHHGGIVFLLSMTVFFSTSLVNTFLKLDDNESWHLRVINFFKMASLTLAILSLFILSYETALKLIFFLSISLVISCAFLYSKIDKIDSREANIYKLAWFFAGFGGMLQAFLEVGFLNSTRFNDPILNHCTVLGMTVTSIAFLTIIFRRIKTENDKKNRALSDYNNALNKERVRDQFVLLGHELAGLQHDLRTSLVPIGSAISLLGKSENERNKRASAIAKSGWKRMQSTLNDIQSYTTPDAEGSRKPVPVAEILTSTRNLVRGLHDYGWHNSITDEVVYGARDALSNVFNNLARNSVYALEKTNKPEKIISVDAKTVEDKTVITWQDNGIGIPPDIIGRIFDPYFTTKPDGEGDGIGMCRAKSTIELHGGTIRVESILGANTKFIIELPNLSK